MTRNGMWLVPREGEWDDLVDFWRCMEWPEGSRVEIVEGVVTVTPSASVPHHLIAGDLHRALHQATPDEWGIYQRLSIAVPPAGACTCPTCSSCPSSGRAAATSTTSRQPAPS